MKLTFGKMPRTLWPVLETTFKTSLQTAWICLPMHSGVGLTSVEWSIYEREQQKCSFFLSRGAAGALDIPLIVITIRFYSPYSVFSMKRGLDNNSKGQAMSRNECDNEEVINMHREIEDLQRLISRVKGDWLDGLGLKELQQLEQKLESGLTRVRSEKEIKLREENKNLRRQIKELCSKALQDPESSECISNLEALHAYLEESSDSDTSLQLGL